MIIEVLIKIKRFFQVEGTKREKLMVLCPLILVIIALTGVTVLGYTVVYARTYDVMNVTPIVVWDVEKTESETIVTYLGKEYRF